MDPDEHDAATAKTHTTWIVVNLDRQYQQTVLVTRWRWYAAWWALSLRLFDGDDLKIVRTS